MTSQADRSLLVEAFDSAIYPPGVGLTPETAWLGIYQLLWWYEHGVLHVREANDLKKPIWRERAAGLETYIADQIDVDPSLLRHHVDLMMRLPRWEGMQRNNPVGNGLRILFSELCQRFANPAFSYPEEQDANNWFPGITMPGRSKKPKVDVAAIRKKGGRPKAVLSCKWSIRHDRISDPTNECVQYKSAAVQQQVMDLDYYVLTNEMSVSRLDKVINQPCVDGLIHVHLPSVGVLEPPSDLMAHAVATGRLVDMADFIRDTAKWL
ncbi:MAG: hypothetical protein K0U84_03435 [Actinomycetia bacterium]|nr:hypothetical protein [Actinomycetes bacterium]